MTAFFCYMMSRGREWNLYLLHSGSQIHFPCNKPARTHPQISCWIVFRTRLFTKQHTASSASTASCTACTLLQENTQIWPKGRSPRWRSPPRKNTRYITWWSVEKSQLSVWTMPIRQSGQRRAFSPQRPDQRGLRRTQCRTAGRGSCSAFGHCQHTPGHAHGTQGSQGEGCTGCDS